MDDFSREIHLPVYTKKGSLQKLYFGPALGTLKRERLTSEVKETAML